MTFIKKTYKPELSLQWCHKERDGVSNHRRHDCLLKHQSYASLAFVRVIHRWPVNSPHKGPAAPKMFPFDDVIMIASKSRRIELRHSLQGRSSYFVLCSQVGKSDPIPDINNYRGISVLSVFINIFVKAANNRLNFVSTHVHAHVNVGLPRIVCLSIRCWALLMIRADGFNGGFHYH